MLHYAIDFQTLFHLAHFNAQGIGNSSLDSYLATLEDSDSVLETCDQLEEVIAEHSGEFTRVEGSGLYFMHSKLNHSCDPNAEVRFETGDNRLTIWSLRDIEQGEEVCIGYLDFEHECRHEGCECDDAVDVQDRQSLLKKFYHFECMCEICSVEDSIIPLR